MRPPVQWFGGKTLFRNTIIQHFPKHKIYAEPFGGGGSVLLKKELSPVEIYNDINSGLCSVFKALKENRKQLQELCFLTPYSRTENEAAVAALLSGLLEQLDNVSAAHLFMYITQTSFGGRTNGGFGYATTVNAGRMAKTNSKWLSIIKTLPEIAARLENVQIHNEDFRKIFKQFDSKKTLFYIDPPYVADTRKTGVYADEMSDKEHGDLVRHILNLKGKAVLSGYKNKVYKELEKNDFKRLDFGTTCKAVGKTKKTNLKGENILNKNQKRVESLWLCPRTRRELGL